MTAAADALMAIFGFKRVEGSEMTKKNDGEPAFPHSRLGSDHDGMQLRDYFAAKAMPVLLEKSDEWPMTFGDVANQAYSIADAMLAAREPQQ